MCVCVCVCVFVHLSDEDNPLSIDERSTLVIVCAKMGYEANPRLESPGTVGAGGRCFSMGVRLLLFPGLSACFCILLSVALAIISSLMHRCPPVFSVFGCFFPTFPVDVEGFR